MSIIGSEKTMMLCGMISTPNRAGMPMTASVMSAFGVEVELDQVDWRRFAVALP